MSISRKRKLLMAGVTIGLQVMMIGSPTHASSGSSGRMNGDGAEVGGHSTTPGTSKKPRGNSRSDASGPAVEVTKTPACGRNNPAAQDDNLCTGAVANCPPGEVLTRTFTSTNGGRWINGGTRCEVLGEGTQQIVIPTVTLADLQRIGLPASPLNLQPHTGQTLLNVPLILTTTSDTITRDTTVLGYPVTIRATPTTWTWTLGDGTTLGPTTDPGSPYPHQTLTHTYTDPGHHQITLTTTWTGEYTIAGLPYRPIDGTATTTSPATTVHVLSGNNVLTAPEQ